MCKPTDNCKPIALGTETVKSTAGTLESIDHVKGSNSFTSFHEHSTCEHIEEWAHRLACSVYVTESRITFSRKILRTPRVSS